MYIPISTPDPKQLSLAIDEVVQQNSNRTLYAFCVAMLAIVIFSVTVEVAPLLLLVGVLALMLHEFQKGEDVRRRKLKHQEVHFEGVVAGFDRHHNHLESELSEPLDEFEKALLARAEQKCREMAASAPAPIKETIPT